VRCFRARTNVVLFQVKYTNQVWFRTVPDQNSVRHEPVRTPGKVRLLISSPRRTKGGGKKADCVTGCIAAMFHSPRVAGRESVLK